MTELLIIAVAVICLVLYAVVLDWAYRGQEAMVAELEEELAKDHER